MAVDFAHISLNWGMRPVGPYKSSARLNTNNKIRRSWINLYPIVQVEYWKMPVCVVSHL